MMDLRDVMLEKVEGFFERLNVNLSTRSMPNYNPEIPDEEVIELLFEFRIKEDETAIELRYLSRIIQAVLMSNNIEATISIRPYSIGSTGITYHRQHLNSLELEFNLTNLLYKELLEEYSSESIDSYLDLMYEELKI